MKIKMKNEMKLTKWNVNELLGPADHWLKDILLACNNESPTKDFWGFYSFLFCKHGFKTIAHSNGHCASVH